MADPLSIIGAAASIAGIMDLVGKTVSTLRELHGQWKEADFTFLNLISQLTALRAGLDKISEWMEVEMGEPHHQLVMDLEVSISCCMMLVSKLDAHAEELQRDANDKLVFWGKMKMVVKNGTLEELQKMVERQTIGLTLLLTACNCKAISEQKTVLEQKSSRKIFRRIRDDTSSLYVQRDTSSLHSRWTGTVSSISKFSKVFDFDRELFISKVYERVIRNSLKDAAKKSRKSANREQKLGPLQETPRIAPANSYSKATARSQMIDKTLEEDSRRLRREVKILMLGDSECCQTMVKQMKIIHQNGYTEAGMASHKQAVKRNVLDAMRSMLAVAKIARGELDQTTNANVELLSRKIEGIGSNSGEITINKATVTAVEALWANEQFRKIFSESTDVYVPDSASYFIEEIQRIAQETYIPVETDILRTKTKTTGIYETRFNMESLSIHLFDVGGQRSDRRKWIHSFENITSILFTVDLSSYDQVLLEESNQNGMMESLVLFDSIVNSHWFRHASIILFFCNIAEFKQKLSHSPLSNYFPDYSGGDDVNRAAKYLLWRFNQVNRQHLRLYPHLADITDTSNIRLVFAAVKETLLQNALVDARLCPIKFEA
ncbi:hypothetical protein G7Y89_g12839 [Cudoniella acicularis]|uniref:Uncharacterized protein n=1 Tax=Cudoniella acicularis TaxID=354080 RepID=A0A8H4R8D0_9HELO|nr:hypothetical protein G7Y89_g12839 [Cudoniella acicularis]